MSNPVSDLAGGGGGGVGWGLTVAHIQSSHC